MFSERENIRRFRAQLAQETSPGQREVLQGLLGEAEAELKELEDASTPQRVQDDAALRLFAEHVVDEAIKLHRGQLGVLQVHDMPLGGLIILAQRNFRPEFLRPFALIKLDDPTSISARCFNEGRTIAVGDMNQDRGFPNSRETAYQGGFAAVQSSPVRNRSGELIGVISTHFTMPQHFSEEDIRRMDRYAASIGPDLERRMGPSLAH